MFQFSQRVVQVCTRIATIVLLLFAGFPVTNLPNSVDAADTSSCQWKWKRVPSPNGGAYTNALRRIAVNGPNDIWAIGHARNSTDNSETLIEHWDGTAWSITPSPNANVGASILLGISAAAANDVWAVGYQYENSVFRPLIEHWNGTAWDLVSPPEDLLHATLWSVAAVSTNDVWAVGGESEGPNTANHPLVLHWDGTTWSRTSILQPYPPFGFLGDLTVVAPNDIWAVGGYSNDPPPAVRKTLVLRFDGEEWSIVPSPNESPGLHVNDLLSVAASSSQEIWAVGYHLLPHPGIAYDLIEHWNGASWTIVQDLFGNKAGVLAEAVATASSGNVWVVGSYRSALIEHWNGEIWQDASPNNGTGYLYDVATIGTEKVWAVGELTTGLNETQTLIVQGHMRCRKPLPCSLAPALISPTQNKVVEKNPVRLDWKDRKCATHYQIQIKRNSPDDTIVKRARRVRVSEYMFWRSTSDKTFVWRVRACNSQGCGEWSVWNSFKLQTGQN